MRLVRALEAIAKRFLSATIISVICRRRVVCARSSTVKASGKGRTAGRTASPNRASTSASMLSVLANWPVALAKSLTWRGLTTTAGNSAQTRARVAWRSKTTGGLQHDQCGPDFTQPSDQSLDAGLVVGNRFSLARGAYSDI